MRFERWPWLVEAHVAVRADAENLEPNPADGADGGLVPGALGFDIGRGAVEKVDAAWIEVHVTEQVLLHELATKKIMGFDPEQTFEVAPDVIEHTRGALERGKQAEAAWQESFDAWAARYRQRKELFDRMRTRSLPAGWEKAVPSFPADAKGVATRVASGEVLTAVAPELPELWGGSADLAGSNNTTPKGQPSSTAAALSTKDFSGDQYGRVLHFGIREHGMGSVMNGIALHGGTRLSWWRRTPSLAWRWWACGGDDLVVGGAFEWGSGPGGNLLVDFKYARGIVVRTFRRVAPCPFWLGWTKFIVTPDCWFSCRYVDRHVVDRQERQREAANRAESELHCRRSLAWGCIFLISAITTASSFCRPSLVWA